MANISNINNVLRTGSTGIGINCDPEFTLDVERASASAVLSLNSVGGSGAEYLIFSGTDGSLTFNKRYVGDRLLISSGGDATFSGNIGIGGAPGQNLDIQKSGARFRMIDGTNQFNMGLWDGSNYRFEGDANRPIYMTSYEGNINFGISGGTTMTIQNGKVGIGTTSPDAQLEIEKSASGAVGPTLLLNNSAGGNADKGNIIFASYGNTYQRAKIEFKVSSETDSPGNIDFYTGRSDLGTLTQKMTILGSGNVGIGVTNPSSKLTVDGLIELDEASGAHGFINTDGTNYEFDINRNPVTGAISDSAKGCARIAMRAEDGGAGSRIIFSTANANNTTASERMRIDKNGNVGIGLSDPDQALEIGAAGKLKLSRADNARSMLLYTDNSYGTIETDVDPILIKSAHRVSFSLAGSEKVRFQEDGKVGIGTTSPAQMLEIYSGGFAYARFKSASYGATGFDIGQHTGGNIYLNNRDNTAMIFMTNNAERMNILAGGEVNMYNTLNINSPSGAGDKGVQIKHSNGNKAAELIHGGTGDEGMLKLYDSNTETVRIAGENNVASYINSGNVGIGTTNPQTALTLPQGSGAANKISWYDATPNFAASIYANSSNDSLTFATKNSSNVETTAMVININQNVGIGTTVIPNPFSGAYSNILQVGTNSGNTRLAITAGSTSSSDLAFADSNGTDAGSYAGAISYKHNGDYMIFSTNASEKMRITSGGYVGVGTTSPTTKLTVKGVITAGDSSTDAVIRRQHQTFSTMKPGPSSGGSVDMMFVDHTNALDITVMAYINTSNVATGKGYLVTAYGSAVGGLSNTRFAGVISALSISYVNTGGSENYVLRVTCTYSGVTAPTISVTASGQSTSELRQAI